ncbi:MAG: hypothetical protein KF773_04520 [Deltaproteobacteria bacterium]|nr:hypothetical protein [Deltaproteobacteria bacterium]MCW5801046.1 hypothetical protein [Deltaproteobacteria bacterium]
MPVRRSLSAFVSAGVLVALAGVASADKPRIAVLGLEAGLDNGVVDQATTRVAKTLTNGLRSHAASVKSTYQLAPGSNRELLDEKLMKSCDSEKPECMAPIGTELTTDYLLFGRVDKATEGGVQGYRLQIKLLDVKKRNEQGPWKKFVAAGQATAAWAEDVYAEVTGEVKETVIVGPAPPRPKPKGDGNGWKTMAYVSGATTLVLGSAFAASALILRDVNYGKTTDGVANCPITPKPDEPFGCRHGEALATTTKVAGWGAVLGAAVTAGAAGVAIYKSSRGDKERATQAGRERRRNLTVTPILAPDGGGATVRIDW